MDWLQQMPIRRRLTLIILAVCGVVLVLSCVALFAFERFDFRRALARDAVVMADIIGGNSRAALAFDDEAAAREVLRALQSESHIVAAGLYSFSGTLFAEYVRPGAQVQFPKQPGADGRRFEDDRLVVSRAVIQNGRRIGTVYLQTDLDGIDHRLLLFGKIAVLVLLGSFLVALALSSWLQRPLTQPILELTETTRAISERKDYSVRATRRTGGEIGTLTDVFNEMLAGIEVREYALRTANEALNEEVIERKRTEAALAAGEEQYRLIFEHSPLPKWIYDVETLRFLAANKAAKAQYGFSDEEFLAMTIRDIRPPEDIPALETDVTRAQKVVTEPGEWRHRRKDGTIVSVVVHAHDVEMGGRRARMVVAQDITERKLTDAKVRAQLDRLAQLSQITRAVSERQDVESIFQAVVRSLEDQMPADFTCVCLYDGNAEALTVTRVGARSAELAEQLTIPERTKFAIDQNGLSRCVQGHLVYEPDVSQVAMPFPRKLAGGGLRSVVMAPLRVESKVFGVLLAARKQPNSFTSGDCEFLRQLSEHVALAAHQAQLYTALQRAYDDLRQTQQVVMQQERLRALGQMASGIAHDINNAISPISLYVESLLEHEPNLSAQSREWLQVVARAIDDVSHTVARLREFYRQREPQLALSSVPLNRVVEQVAELTRARWSDMPQQRGQVIELQRDLDPDLPNIMAVESEIREALINLVFNAVDAMPEGGKLILRTRKIERPRRESAAAPESLVSIEVADTGSGMDEETQRRCMEPFFTTKGERGTGLGLAMVYGIVRRHGADIELDTAPGRGTTVRLLFAVIHRAAAGSLQPASALKSATRLRLLVVDDDPLILKSVRETLEVDGHVIVTANGGQAGIDAFREAKEHGEPFSAVITDLGMPYVDGRKVASAVKSIAPTITVILLTGWGQRLISDGDMPPDVDRVLSKPPKLRELREAIASVPTA